VKRVRWYYRAREDLLAIPSVDDAAGVDAAVQYFARTGVGFVPQMDDELRLPAVAPVPGQEHRRHPLPAPSLRRPFAGRHARVYPLTPSRC
jgi:hypothetical protein